MPSQAAIYPLIDRAKISSRASPKVSRPARAPAGRDGNRLRFSGPAGTHEKTAGGKGAKPSEAPQPAPTRRAGGFYSIVTLALCSAIAAPPFVTTTE